MVLGALLILAPGRGSSAQESAKEPAGEEPAIRSLFDQGQILGDDRPWDLEGIQAMTLDNLGAELYDLDGNGVCDEQIVEAGFYGAVYEYRMIECRFGYSGSNPDAFPDRYTMVDRDDFYSGNLASYKTRPLHHFAIFILPRDYPAGSPSGIAALHSIHSLQPKEGSPGYFILDRRSKFEAVEAVRRYGVPVVLHGEAPDNWEQFGYESQDEILIHSALAVGLENRCGGDVLKMYYGYALLRENLMAITLAGRILDEIAGAPGLGIGNGVLCRGGSKQGSICWLIGLVEDMRVRALMPGGYHLISARSLFDSVQDWGCPSWTEYAWIDQDPEADPPVADRSLLSLGVRSRAAMFEWMSCGAPGEAASDFFSVFNIHDRLSRLDHIDLISVHGQVARYKGWQWQWNPGTGACLELVREHDWQFPLGAETAFLDELDAVRPPPHSRLRYARERPDYSDAPGEEPPICFDRVDLNWLEAVHQLVDPDPSRWVDVSCETAVVDEGVLTASARVDAGASTEVEAVHLYHALSSANGIWNDEEQSPGNPYAWRRTPMSPGGNGFWHAAVGVEAGLAVAWHIEAEGRLDASSPPDETLVFDSTPPRFLRRAPPVDTGCSDVEVHEMRWFPNPPAAAQPLEIIVDFSADRLPPVPSAATDPQYYLDLKIDAVLMVDGVWAADRRRLSINGGGQVLFVWDNPAAGSHLLEVVLDPPHDGEAGALPEYNENNNFIAREIVVQ